MGLGVATHAQLYGRMGGDEVPPFSWKQARRIGRRFAGRVCLRSEGPQQAGKLAGKRAGKKEADMEQRTGIAAAGSILAAVASFVLTLAPATRSGGWCWR